MNIIDGHSHVFTEPICKAMGMDLEHNLIEKKEGLTCSVKENVDTWLKAMDEHGIEKTVFMATAQLQKDFIEFIGSSDRFVGFAKINPTLPNALETFEKERTHGMKGVKLYATNDGFDVGDQKAYPFYDYCQSNGIPIVIHFGVTIGHTSDLAKGNPLLISRVVKQFPKLSIIIAHFGAGFFREVLMLRYKCDNLYVDTSGTNNWLVNQDNFLTLQDVFKKTLQVFGPQHMVFGTDTRIFPDGYRAHILQEQLDILQKLGVREADQEDIMYGNAKRVFAL